MKLSSNGPLAGCTVIELAGIGPGPFACMMLADMGARIIRIDRPARSGGGDLENLMRNDGIVDRGRESIALDLKQPASVEVVLRLIEKADGLIEGWRPGVAEKLGLGPDVCLARQPRLAYGRMTGWGQTGPLAHAAGHDINYISLSGALHSMGSADGSPMPPLNLVGDYGGGGMLLAFGMVCAMLEARTSGQGQVIDAAMTDGAATLMSAIYSLRAKGFWKDARGVNFLDGSAHFYGTFECADGKFVSVGAIEPQFYVVLLERIGVDPTGLATQWEGDDWPALRARFADVFRTRTRAQWCELLEGTDACFAPVLDMGEAVTHPHNVARGTFDVNNGIVQPNPAPRFSRTPCVLPHAAPHAGRDTVQLLREAGYDDAAAHELRRAGVAVQAD